MERKYSFWFHYNKIQSKIQNKNILTVHYKGVCHYVENIECNVPVKSKNRKSQPRCVLAGKGNVEIKDNIAVIT